MPHYRGTQWVKSAPSKVAWFNFLPLQIYYLIQQLLVQHYHVPETGYKLVGAMTQPPSPQR